MSKRVMKREASDNPYLHKDFHGALSVGIEYIHRRYGPSAVRDYLRQFTRSYHAPLREKLRRRGLPALRDYFRELYRLEKSPIRLRCTSDELVLRVPACPAVRHMRRRGYPVARLFVETTRTVGRALCEGTPFAYELLEYDERTGRSVQRFTRRSFR